MYRPVSAVRKREGGRERGVGWERERRGEGYAGARGRGKVKV